MKATKLIAEWRRTALFDLEEAVRGVVGYVWWNRTKRRYEEVDAVLEEMDPADFPDSFLIELLMVTAAHAVEYPAREDFFKRVRRKLVKKHRVKKADRMLAGLACEEGWKPVAAVEGGDDQRTSL